MGITDSLMDGFQQNLGVTEKAIIEVIDFGMRKEDMVKQGSQKVLGADKGASNMRTGKALVNKGMMADEYKAIAKMGKDENPTDKRLENVANDWRRYFTVQFNPSTLQLSGHAGGLVRKLDFENSKPDQEKDGPPKPGEKPPKKFERSASYTQGPTSIIMSVSLLFDSCDPQGAFLDDKLNLNPTSVLTGGAKMLMQAAGEKKVSVQTEVEGFIAALRNRKTRLMTFYWGDFCYTGVLRSVGANYTMFNPNGEPIRATVDLSMVCADKDQWPNSIIVWQQRYINSFKKSESFVKTEQKAGKLLNL